MTDEQRELFRIAGQRILDQSAGGARFAPLVLRRAMRWAAAKPLGRPLGPGNPPHARIQGGSQ